MKSESVRFLSVHVEKRPDQRLFKRDRVRFCETRSDTTVLMKFSIQLYLTKLSISTIFYTNDMIGVNRAWSTVHNWVDKADLHPEPDQNPDYGAVDETVT